MRKELKERGGKTALLVVDVQNAVVEDGWDRDGVLDRIGLVIDAARETGVPIVYVQHESPGSERMARGTEGWLIHPEVAPISGEPIVAKLYGDAFVETTLPDILAELGAGHLIITGAQSDACIRATSHRALMEGYDITLVSDAHTTSDYTWNGITISAEMNVAQVNSASPWIGYPNTTSAIASHSEIIDGFRSASLA